MAKRRRRRNPKRRTIIIAAASTAVVAAGAAGVWWWYRKRPREICWTTEMGNECCSYPGEQLPVCGPVPGGGPQGAGGAQPGVEPIEGWEARWLERRHHAIDSCRAKDSVMTWPSAVTCVLETAFPESGPWSDAPNWSDWMGEAAMQVEEDLRKAVADAYGTNDPSGWQGLLWLQGHRAAKRCAAQNLSGGQLATCIAQDLYPNETWPPFAATAPQWAKEFYLAVRRFARDWTPPTQADVSWPAQPGA